MENFIQPELSQRANKIWQKHGFKIILVSLALLLIACGYLIYIYYLAPAYELEQLLPENYDISFELKLNRFALPEIQKKELLSNKTINRVYLAGKLGIDDYLNKLPLATQADLKKFKQLILFTDSLENIGLIGKIPDRQTYRKILSGNFPDLFAKILKKQILIVSNNETLLKEMAGRKLTAATLPYFSLSFGNWLKINIQNSFFEKKYPNPTITELQKILWPLTLTKNSYSLKFNAGFKYLELFLTPAVKPKSVSPSLLDKFLAYLPANSDFVLGLNDLSVLTAGLETNNNLQDLLKQADYYLWQNYQISLSNLIKTIKGPILIGINDKTWRIITVMDNKDLAKSLLKQYFGQFKPKTKKNTLPDGSLATELIADPDSVSFIEFDRDGWHFSLIAPDKKIGYISQNNLLIISNDLDNINNGNFRLCQNKNLHSVFSILPGDSQFKIADSLLEFNKIEVINNIAGEIKVCLELK